MLTKTATKLLKNSKRIICQTAEDGYIYIGTGYFVFRVTPYEYTEFVQPATMREAGDYDMTATDCKPRELDLARILADSAASVNKGGAVKLANISFNTGKSELVPAACKEKNFVSFFNRGFLESFPGLCDLRSVGACSPMVGYSDGEPVAMWMPVRPEDSFLAAARGYFGMNAPQASAVDSKALADLRGRLAEKETAVTQLSQENALLRANLESLRASKSSTPSDVAETISALRAQLSAANQELEELKDREAQAATAQKIPVEPVQAVQEAPAAQQEGADVQSVVDKFSAIPGATVTVKGSRTSSPVVWIVAATGEAEKAIKAAGARWAAKRGAYYYNCSVA